MGDDHSGRNFLIVLFLFFAFVITAYLAIQITEEVEVTTHKPTTKLDDGIPASQERSKNYCRIIYKDSYVPGGAKITRVVCEGATDCFLTEDEKVIKACLDCKNECYDSMAICMRNTTTSTTTSLPTIWWNNTGFANQTIKFKPMNTTLPDACTDYEACISFAPMVFEQLTITTTTVPCEDYHETVDGILQVYKCRTTTTTILPIGKAPNFSGCEVIVDDGILKYECYNTTTIPQIPGLKEAVKEVLTEIKNEPAIIFREKKEGEKDFYCLAAPMRGSGVIIVTVPEGLLCNRTHLWQPKNHV